MAATGRIAFDCSGQDYDEAEWDRICHDVSKALEDAGLPSLYGKRWRESDGSCVLEGQIDEIAKVREILSKFPVAILN